MRFIFPQILLLLAHTAFSKYIFTMTTEDETGMTGSLNWEDMGEVLPGNQQPISPLSVSIMFQTDAQIRVQIKDSTSPRWEVPGIVQDTEATTSNNSLYAVTVVNDPFKITVSRKSNNDIIWESLPLLYADQYLEWGTVTVVNPYISGLGERISPLRLDNDKTYMLMATDQGSPLDGEPLYGHHPFYLENRAQLSSGAHGVFLLNSNAMDVELKAVEEPSTVTFKTTGGIIDMFLFLGPSPHDVATQYHQVIGKPAMPPYWSLGFHQCRW